MKRTKRQDEILDIALNLLADGGVKNLTMKRIAESIGVSEPAVYRHFKNKTEIVKGIIEKFDDNIILKNEGIEFVWNFVEQRISQVSAAPVLAKVIFAEELFAGEREVEEMLFSMMHKHRDLLFKHIIIAQNNGDICQNIPVDALFRIIIGPVRLLVKQWGMSNYAFDIKVKGRELLESLQTILKK